MAERVKLRVGSVARAVLITGQAYQDPKDALNEFISNAADEYLESGERGRIRVVLRRRGRYPTIAVDDDGHGMTPDRLREVARNLFKSVKAGDDRTLGEKAIGLLAFQQLGAKMDVVSRAEGSTETWCLSLERGAASADLDLERRRTRDRSGTTIYLRDLDKEVLRMLTQRKIVDYVRSRRGAALEQDLYEVEVAEGQTAIIVTPETPDGVLVPLPTHTTLWGPIEFQLFVAPPDEKARAVAVVGRAATTVLDDVTELEEFAEPPWNSGQVSGRVTFEALQQSAGRRAVLRDDDAFPIFVETVRSITPTVSALVQRIAAEVDVDTSERMSQEIRRVFATVLKELDDLDNPMRSAIEVNQAEPANDDLLPSKKRASPPDLSELRSRSRGPSGNGQTGTPDSVRTRQSRLPTIAADPFPASPRSRYDAEDQVVLYNDRHPDYLMVKGDETHLLDYFATLVAKEYVVYNNPRARPEELAEEMVRMVVRVRKHLSTRRTKRRR